MEGRVPQGSGHEGDVDQAGLQANWEILSKQFEDKKRHLQETLETTQPQVFN